MWYLAVKIRAMPPELQDKFQLVELRENLIREAKEPKYGLIMKHLRKVDKYITDKKL